MSFYLRQMYGYTEQEILGNIEIYGVDWVYSAYKTAREEEYLNRIWALNCSLAAQTPQSKKGASQSNKHVKNMYSFADSYVPWMAEKKSVAAKETIRRRMESPPRSKVIASGELPPDAQAFFESLKGKVETEQH